MCIFLLKKNINKLKNIMYLVYVTIWQGCRLTTIQYICFHTNGHESFFLFKKSYLYYNKAIDTCI